MTVAIKKINQIQDGVPKNDFEKSLQRISDQVRSMDQKLTMRIENNIWESFQNQQNEIRYIEMMIERIREPV